MEFAMKKKAEKALDSLLIYQEEEKGDLRVKL